MSRRAPLVAAVLVALAAAPAWAVSDPAELLSNPAQEARAEAIGARLRCLVCQNESIEDSNADLARDIRTIIRQQVVAGRSNREIVGYMVQRYGNFILLKPPFKLETLLLWAGAPLALLFGALALWRAARSKETATPALSEAEEARLAAIAEEGGEHVIARERSDEAIQTKL